MPNRSTLSQDSGSRYWGVALAVLPFVYLLILTLPRPLGLGLQIENDFPYHRIWYTQIDTYFISKGYFPLWNPTYQMGSPHLASGFGTASLYPVRWLTYPLTYFGGPLTYLAQYAMIAGHLSMAMLALFAVLRRHAGTSCAASALGAAMLLLNHCFNNFMRFPHGVENFAWVPCMLFFGLNLARNSHSGVHTEKGGAVKDAMALSLCVAMSLLTGYGTFSYSGALFVGIVVLCSAQSLRGIARVVLAGLLGPLLAIGAVLPAAEWVMGHAHRDGANVANIHVVGTTDYIGSFLRPFAVDIHYSIFTFPALAALSLVGIAVAWRRPSARVSVGMLVSLLLIVDIARGRHSLTFEFLYYHLPFFGAFNGPAKNTWVVFLPLGWFAALGADAILSRPRMKILALDPIVLMGVALAWQYSPEPRPNAVGIWIPLQTGWIQPVQSTHAYWWLAIGGGLAVSCYLSLRSRHVQALALGALCLLFVAFYARFDTFVTRDYVPQATMATADGYPTGLMGRRTVPQGYLGMTGIGPTSPATNPRIHQLMMTKTAEVLGFDGTRFPATRFLWRPSDGSTAAKLKLASFGPNHIYFDVLAEGSGDLIYLNKHSRHWRSNHPYDRDEHYGEFLRFHVERGEHAIQLSFVPISHILTSAATLLGIFGVAGLLARRHGRRKIGLACWIASVALTGAMLTGSLTRHTLSNRELYGAGNVSLDPSGTLPATVIAGDGA